MIIRREDRITYANIPFPYLEKLKPIFAEQGFEYEILFGLDIPADLPQCVDIEGINASSGVYCIKSNVSNIKNNFADKNKNPSQTNVLGFF